MKNSIYTTFVVGAVASGLSAQELCIESSQKLLAADQNPGALFGIHVDVDGPTLVVGASDSGTVLKNAGAAYVFTDTGSGWSESVRLESTDLDISDFVGYSVAIDGDVVVAGAWGEDEDASLAGAAYVFERDFGGAGNWGQRIKLLAPNGASNDLFGFDVAVSGGMIAVGAPLDNGTELDQGSVLLYEWDDVGEAWVYLKRLQAPDPIADAQFGVAVAIDGDTIVVGAFGDNQTGSVAGAAYVFERDLNGVNNWGLRTKLVATNPDGNNQNNDQFGFEVSIDQDRIVAGAIKRDLGGIFSGSAYLFERDEGGEDAWGQVAELRASDAHSGQQFGNSVDVHGDRIVVGALRTDTPDDQAGAAYVFERDELGVWQEKLILTNENSETGDLFGSSVAIQNDTVVVGARFDIENEIDGGSATVVGLAVGCDEQCPADLNEDGSLDIFDLFAFLDAYNAMDPIADFTGDGVFDIFDVFAYLNEFNAGCP